jgi:hypothetical protein
LTRYKQKYQEIAALERVRTWCPDPSFSTWIAQRSVLSHKSEVTLPLPVTQSVLVLRPTADSSLCIMCIFSFLGYNLSYPARPLARRHVSLCHNL